MVLRIDELNTLRSMPYEKYFGGMNITEAQKRRRIELADDFELFMLTLLYTVDEMRDYGGVDWDFIYDRAVNGYQDVVQSQDKYAGALAETFARDFVRATKGIENDTSLLALWLLSEDRARYNAENEANNVLNYIEHQEAINGGYTMKTWHTELDNRVRETHVPMEGVTVGIHDFFKVGASFMLYPKYYDPLLVDPREVVNCRCAVSYS